MKTFVSIILLALCQSVFPQETAPKKNIFQRFWHEFNYIDTAYVEPNHYECACMLQNTNSFEWLRIHNDNVKMPFASDPLIKIGPSIGWRWLFIGYSYALNQAGDRRSARTEFELSLYGSMMGCDLLYRKTGDDFRWSNASTFNFIGMPNGEYSGGISLSTLGINLYYIFNHRRFSHPALFSQSTVQKRSCGSFMLGSAITMHNYDFNVENWPVGMNIIDDGTKQQTLKFTSYSINVGYGYNWVIRKNLMLGISFMPALSYKHLSSKSSIQYVEDKNVSDWIGNNLNVDFTARAALVWNNNTFFAGTSLVFHNYNFSRDKLTVRNTFGTINFYVGLNFIKLMIQDRSATFQ